MKTTALVEEPGNSCYSRLNLFKNHLLEMTKEELVCSGFSLNKEKFLSSLKSSGEGDSRRHCLCPCGYLGISTFLPLIRIRKGTKGRTAVWSLSLAVGSHHKTYRKEMWILQRMEFPKWSCHRRQADAFSLAPYFPSPPL